jgi:glycosyltransferase involved in cell wall biosynthesis
MQSIPLVSICCATYNHKAFIQDAIEGFLAQDVDFALEIIINDDASTDGTTAIIKEYQEKYSDLIRAVYQEENQYSKGGVSPFLHLLYPKANGKYIAMCEGDDYWTDPLKLQKQVNFLESNPDHVLACGGWITVGGDESSRTVVHGRPGDGKGFTFDLQDIASVWLTQPLTVVFRTEALCTRDFDSYELTRDVHLFYHLLKKGRGFYFREPLGVYRVHPDGVYSSLGNYERKYLRYRVYRELHDQNSDYYTRRKLFIAASDLIIHDIFQRQDGPKEEDLGTLARCMAATYESPNDLVRFVRQFFLRGLLQLLPRSLSRRLSRKDASRSS